MDPEVMWVEAIKLATAKRPLSPPTVAPPDQLQLDRKEIWTWPRRITN